MTNSYENKPYGDGAGQPQVPYPAPPQNQSAPLTLPRQRNIQFSQPSPTFAPPVNPTPRLPRKRGDGWRTVGIVAVAVAVMIPVTGVALGVNYAVTEHVTANLTPRAFTDPVAEEASATFNPPFPDWVEQGALEDGTIAYVNQAQTCELFTAGYENIEPVDPDQWSGGVGDLEATQQFIASIAETNVETVAQGTETKTLDSTLGADVDVIVMETPEMNVSSLARVFAGSGEGFSVTLACETPQDVQAAWEGILAESSIKFVHKDSLFNPENA